MSFESDEVVVAGTGHIYVAPVGTAMPANISAAVDDAGWVDLGYTTEDALHFVFDRQTKDLMAWQTRDVIRTVVTSEPKRIDFTLEQWNQNTWQLACGGGTFTGSAPNFLFTPPAAGSVDYRALIVALTDGSKHYRFLVQKALNKNPLDFSTRADDMALLPISMTLLVPDGGSTSWTLQTDDSNLGLAASAGS
jgi:hypothetical protein